MLPTRVYFTFRSAVSIFRSAECTFHSGERTFRSAVSIFRSAECTFHSGERTFRSAEHKTKTLL